MSGWSRGWLVALAVALTLHAACTGDDSDDDSSVITDPVETTDSTTSTSTSSSTTETTVDPQAEVEAEVEAAYLAYWDALLEIFAQPNPENSLIDEHTTGTVREATLDAISEDVLNGRAVRPPDDPADFDPQVLDVDVDGGQASVAACVIDGGVVIDADSGEVLDDDVVTLHIAATLRLDMGVWKVADSTVLDEREGRWDCDV